MSREARTELVEVAIVGGEYVAARKSRVIERGGREILKKAIPPQVIVTLETEDGLRFGQDIYPVLKKMGRANEYFATTLFQKMRRYGLLARKTDWGISVPDTDFAEAIEEVMIVH